MRYFPQPGQLKPETLLNRINSNRAPVQRQYFLHNAIANAFTQKMLRFKNSWFAMVCPT